MFFLFFVLVGGGGRRGDDSRTSEDARAIPPRLFKNNRKILATKFESTSYDGYNLIIILYQNWAKL